MITELKLAPDGSNLLTYTRDGAREAVPFEAARQRWPELNAEDLEDICAKVKGDRILLCASIASGQSGAAMLWDAESRTILHASNADYWIACDCDDAWVYTLCLTMHWGAAPFLSLRRAPVGTLDPAYCEDVPCELPFTVDDVDSHRRNDITLRADGLAVALGERRFTIPRP